MSQILLITHWTGGDVFPFIRLGELLKKSEHEVVLFSHCVYRDIAEDRGLKFVNIDSEEQYAAMNRDLHQLADPIQHRNEYVQFNSNYHGKDKLLAEVALLEPYCRRTDTVIIARHRSSISGLLAAEKFELPYATMILAPNYFAHMQLHDEMMGKEFKQEINKAREVLGLKPINSWLEWLYSPKMVLGLWPKWFALGDETWPKGVRVIGFLKNAEMKTEIIWDEKLKSFLKEQEKECRKIVLITGGSSKMITPEFFKVSLEACIKAGCASIIVTPYSECIPKNLPDTVLAMNTIHLNELMKKVDLIIHHGGMGTLSEAIEAEIPQIILPQVTDGPDNAERLAKVKIAKRVPLNQWNSDVIASKINDSFVDGTSQICHEYASLTREESENQIWNELLEEIPVYKCSHEAVKDVSSDKFDNRPSKEQMLAILRRTKRTKEAIK